MESILNFAQPLNVGILDQLLHLMYNGNPQERAASQNLLTRFQEHPDAWTKVDAILESSQNASTKFYALQILDATIKYKWKILPVEQREGIKKYIIDTVIKLSSDATTLHQERVYLSKLNQVLVQIIKQEWPHNWRSFIPEIVGSSRTNESLCENNMNILRILSEEVFDFSSGEMTQAKIKDLKTTFNQEFSLIYQLCEFILDKATRASLIIATLQTLLRFLNWIPLGFIFETTLIDILCQKFLPVPEFRTETLRCLTEISSVDTSDYPHKIETMFGSSMQVIAAALKLHVDIPSAYEDGSSEDQRFIQQLALYFTGLFKQHLRVVEKYGDMVLQAHMYLVSISKVDDSEIFKTCLEYWNFLAMNLYESEPPQQQPPPQQMSGSAWPMDNLHPQPTPRRNFYAQVLSRVRLVMVSKMAKPEEVIIVEDENGEIVKEYMKDVDAIQLYKNMRLVLVYLTHLDPEDTESIMLDKLQAQVNGSEWSWNNINTLSWAIGSISGAMNEKDEKRFLVAVISNLLSLVEMKKGKENKAVIASCIMYIVGQYPRFLRAHWKFLKTVVNKLFEFMHEKFPGVQEMACDTLLKIAQKCKRKFVQLHPSESAPFILEVLTTLGSIISDLEPAQIQTFYEAIAYMVSSANQQDLEPLIAKLHEIPNAKWSAIMRLAAENVENLRSQETMRDLINILKINIRTAGPLGHAYITQLKQIYRDMLEVYKAFSQAISQEVARNGAKATQYSGVRSMRTAKKETLRLVEVFVQKSEDPQIIAQHFVPPLLEAVLGDYQISVPDARDPGVLSLMAVVINKLKDNVLPDIPRILESVLECTLPMITKNFEDYPEHRTNFFTLMRAINANCFQAFFSIPPQGFKLVLDSVLWAVKHTERNISETGLNILLEMLQNVERCNNQQIINSFFQSFFLTLLQDVFYVLTDRLHKTGFKLQASILQQLFMAVATGKITAPLYNPQQHPQCPNNQAFLLDYTCNLLLTAFTNLNRQTVHMFVLGLFDTNKDMATFKEHLRDFLVQVKEFAAQDNADLYEEERQAALQAQREAERQRMNAVPGLIAPSERVDDMNDEQDTPTM